MYNWHFKLKRHSYYFNKKTQYRMNYYEEEMLESWNEDTDEPLLPYCEHRWQYWRG